MRSTDQKKVAFRLVVLSASIASLCLVVLVGDAVLAERRAAGEKSRIDDLVRRVKSDAAVAPRLAEEREIQTRRSVARKTRSRAVAWVLLCAAAGFVAAGKRYVGLEPRRVPELAELVSERFAPPPRGRSAGNGSAIAPRASGSDDGPEVDLSYVDDLVARLGSGRESAIPILQAIQSRFRYLPDEALRRVCELTEITAAQIAGTSSFYARFRRSPVGRHVVRVCHGTACHVAGAGQITSELRRHLQIAEGQDTDPGRRFTLDRVACLGCCSLAPVMMIEDETAGHLTPASARQALDARAPVP